MTWKTITLWDILTESKILSNDPDTDRRITVRLNCGWVEKRSLRNDKSWATKYYIRKKWQFIYGQQNLHNGAFGIIPEELDWYESSWDLPTFDIDSSCKPERLVYFLKQWWFYRWLSRIAKWIWSRRIYPEQLFKIEIPLPSIEEQEKIIKTIKQWLDTGSKLDIITYDNWDLVKRLRQSILQDAIQGKLVPQDSKDEPASELLKRIKTEKEQLIKDKKIKKQKELTLITDTEKLFELPNGWEWLRLGEIVRLSDGEKFTNVEYPYLEARYLRGKGDAKIVNSGKLVYKGQLIILVDWENSWEVFEASEDWCLGSTFKILDYDRIINKSYLIYLISTKKTLLRDNKIGAAIPHLNKNLFKNILVALPPLEEQENIVAKVDELMKFCDNLEKQISEAKENGEKLMESVLGEVFK